MAPYPAIRVVCAGLAVLAMLGISAAQAASQYVVISAEPASEAFTPGKVLKVNDTIEVPEGVVVTLLGEDGSVNAIPGPASVTVTEEELTASAAEIEKNRSVFSRVADLLSGEKPNSDSLGVARSISGDSKFKGLNDPWVVSVHASGQACVKPGEIVLGRASDKLTAALSVEAGDGLEAKGLDWKAGESVFALPEPLASKAGELFVRVGGVQNFIQLHRLPGEIEEDKPLDVLGWMIDSKCNAQALAFAHSLSSIAE